MISQNKIMKDVKDSVKDSVLDSVHISGHISGHISVWNSIRGPVWNSVNFKLKSYDFTK